MKKIYLLFSLLAVVLGFGQNFNPSDRDTGFNSVNVPLNHFFVETNANPKMSAVLPDGKIMVLTNSKNIIKLNGNLRDNSFSLGSFLDNQGDIAILQTFAVQPDGKILVGGNFKSYNGQIRYRLVRLNPDGSLDAGFNAPLSQLGSYGVLKIVLQRNGKILILGDTQINSSSYYNNVGRLNADGSIDTSFVIPINYRFAEIALQSDGKLLVNHNTSNDFNSLVNKLSRLNSDGSFDTSFPTVNFTGLVGGGAGITKLLIQPDGKILAIGYFYNCNSVPRRNLVRINTDGTVDTSFLPGSGPTYESSYDGILDILQQPDGKIMIAGNFITFNGVARPKIARLNPDGSVDTSFADVSSFLNILGVKFISLFNDGKILAYGELSLNQKEGNYLVKINADGTRDNSYNNFEPGFFNSVVNDVYETADGKILVGGDFHTYNGQKCFSFTRLNQDGSVDNTLTYGGSAGFESNFPSYVSAIAQQADGKIYLAGMFSMYNGTSAKSIIRINPDGTRDTTFNLATTAFNSLITKILVKPTGGVLVSGQFSTYNGSSCVGLASISNTGGSVGAYSSLITSSVKGIKYQADGKLLVNDNIGKLRRLATPSTLDSGFILDASMTSVNIELFELQNDGKILIQGTFTIGGVGKSFVRLLSNGSLDPTFDFTGQSSTLQVKNFTIAPDQKIVLFLDNNTSPNIDKVLRLNTDGSVDSSFMQQDYNEQYAMNRTYPKFKITGNGKILLYGDLYTYQGKPARGLIRLMGENYYYLQGQNRLDLNANGCDATDALLPDLKYRITDNVGTNDYDFIANATGNYNVAIPAGNYTVTPIFENPSYYTASPASIPVVFPSQATPQLQSFCITPVGNHPDLEVSVIPTNVARPGFDAKYKIIYKNKGNQSQSGSVNLTYDDNLMDYIIATPAYSMQSTNNLFWNYDNLAPMETREILVTLNLNSPVETPPVTGSTQLSYTATVGSSLTDEMPSDNTFNLNQQVVNSFDPNDKTCLEGSTIATTKVGDYVHYLIRFENTGNYYAQSITVKDVIDVSKFDISTLEPVDGSHLFVTRIINGNKVEFYFDNINLPFADNENDGYVAFMIKTKSTLAEGDSFSNSAAIYFDYNYPVVTDAAITTVQNPLNSAGFNFGNFLTIYPNPAKDVLNIIKKAEIGLSSVSIYDVLGRLTIFIPNADEVQAIDVSPLKTGNYILKITSDKGMLTTKFIIQ